jgi:hypothetical protein
LNVINNGSGATCVAVSTTGAVSNAASCSDVVSTAGTSTADAVSTAAVTAASAAIAGSTCVLAGATVATSLSSDFKNPSNDPIPTPTTRMAAVGAIHGQCFASVMLVSPQEIMFAVQAALGWMADQAVYMWNVALYLVCRPVKITTYDELSTD